jgi:uncharacterized protein YgiM (DUF1202 family)
LLGALLRGIVPRLTAIGIFVAIFLAGLMPARADTRMALVIGNGAYDNVAPLENPGRDARAIAEALKGLGFETTLALDQDSSALKQALRRFTSKAKGADIAAVYYAGHGMEAGGENYLIPVDATLKSDEDIDYELVPLDLVLKAVSGAKQLRLVMLDACRNNPFSAQMAKADGTRGVGRGFVRVEPSNNTLVAYAAKDGTTADDGDGEHSPFAAALLKRLPDPGVEITFLFRNVRDDVLAATAGKQEPFVYGSMGGQPVYLVSAAAAPPPAPTPEPAPIAQVDPKALDLSYWNSIQGSENPVFYESYLKRFPDGTFSELAKAKLDQLKAAAAQKEAQVAALAAPPAPTGPVVEPMTGTYIATRATVIRSAPEDAAKSSKKLRIDDAVAVTGRVKDSDWLRVGEGDQSGYVPLADLAAVDDGEVEAWSTLRKAPTLATAKEFQAQFPDSPFKDRVAAIVQELTPPPIEIESLDVTYVVKQTANVRAEPNATAKLLGKLTPDAGVAVTGKVKGKEWLRVQQGTDTGYVSGSQLAPIDASEITDWQALQTTPTYETAKAYLQKHPSGYFKDRVTQIAQKLAPPPPAPAAPEIETLSGTYVAVQSANVRAEPNAAAKALGRLNADDAVSVTGKLKDGDWLRVDREGQAAFVSAKLLQKVDENELKAWRQLAAAPGLEAADAFITQYPNGYFAPKAQVLKASLQPKPAEPGPAVAAAAPGPEPDPSDAVSMPEVATQSAAVMPAPLQNSAPTEIQVGQVFTLTFTSGGAYAQGEITIESQPSPAEFAGQGELTTRAWHAHSGSHAVLATIKVDGDEISIRGSSSQGGVRFSLKRIGPGKYYGTANVFAVSGNGTMILKEATGVEEAAITPPKQEGGAPTGLKVGDVLQMTANLRGTSACIDGTAFLSLDGKLTMVSTAGDGKFVGRFSGRAASQQPGDFEVSYDGDTVDLSIQTDRLNISFNLKQEKPGLYTGTGSGNIFTGTCSSRARGPVSLALTGE